MWFKYYRLLIFLFSCHEYALIITKVILNEFVIKMINKFTQATIKRKNKTGHIRIFEIIKSYNKYTYVFFYLYFL